MDLEQLRTDVAEALGCPPHQVGDDDDLLYRGMDSIAVMRLASRWQAGGAAVTFAELIEFRTPAQWWELIRSRLDTPVSAGAVTHVPEDEPFPLAPMQQAYWIGRSDGQPLGGVGAHFYNEFDGSDVDPDRLETAVKAVLARHPMLRAAFLPDGTARILAVSPWPGVTVHDLRGLSEAKREAELDRLREQISHRRLDAEAGHVFDVRLSLLPGGRTRMHVQIEMLVADAHSFRVLLSDLAAAYEHPERTPAPIGLTFPSYLATVKGQPDRTRAAARDYWQRRLDTLPGPPQLPLAVDPARVHGHRTTRFHHWLGSDEQALLRERAGKHGVTLPVAFLTAFTRVLGDWTGHGRFLLNLPLYDRRPVHSDVDRLVGDFTNLLLLEVEARAGSFAGHATEIQQRMRSDAAQAGFGGMEVLRELTRRNGGQPVGAPVVFTSAVSLGELFAEQVRRCFGAPGHTMSQTPQVWLDYQITEREGGLFLNWDVVAELFPEGVCGQMFAAYRRVVDWMLAEADWDQPTPDLLPQETLRVRAQVNATATPARERLLHHDFFAHARTDPDRPAVLWGEAGSWTYGRLAGLARTLAADLAARGVKPGDPVAVSIPKGPGQMLAVLGVLHAGGAYVPIGVDQPPARRERILARSGARVVLEERDLPRAETGGDTALVGDPSQPAYVLFTSGSTGEPKGVAVPHAAALNTIDDLVARCALTPDDRTLAVSALDFDLSVFDMFAMWSAGGAVVAVTEDDRRSPQAWLRSVHEHRVTVWQSVPAVLDLLLQAADADGRRLAVRLALVGGDWVAPGLAPRLSGCADAVLLALGGTTETAIHSTLQQVPARTEWVTVPYGVPLANQRLRVVDELGRDRPDWVPGELWIGGASVAAGYVGDPELTASKFVTWQGVRWYRTGDLARYWPDGTVEFLGRQDLQLKISGHRIEPGEVEAALLEAPGVTHAVAFAVGEGAKRRLAAAVTGDAEPELLRHLLAERLPGYLIPSEIHVIERIPLSPNGKVDRARLSELADRSVFEPPKGAAEQTIARLWSRLLDGAVIGREDNFFALGGDSIIATRVLAGLRAEGLGGVGLADLFNAPVLREFAARVRSGIAGPPQLVADPEHRHDPFPPTDVQRAYWVGRTDDFALGGVGSHWYWEFDGAEVDLDRLEDAVNTLVERHDMLRAVFDDNGDQRVLPRVPRFTIARGDDPEKMRAELSTRVPDPGRWPLIEIHAATGDAGRTHIGFSFDYIVLDALSIVRFFAELSALYLDPAAPMPVPGITFRDYVLRPATETVAAQEYWRGRLDTLAPAAPLPLAANPSALTKTVFHRRQLFLPPEQWRSIVDISRSHRLTPATVLAAAYAEVLSAYSGADRLTLNSTLFQRDDVHPDIDLVLGDFTALLLVGYEAQPGEAWLDTAHRLQRDMWEGMQHSSVSALWVLRELARHTGSGNVAMPIVFTSAIGIAANLVNLRFPFGSLSWGISQTPQVWLDNQVMERDGGLSVNWDSVDALFPEGLLDAMFDAYRRLLEWLATGDWKRPVPELLPASQSQVRERVNDTARAEPWRTLHERVFQADPDRIALIHGDDRRTYGDLTRQALRIAGELARRGIGPQDAVAVTLPRGPDQIAAVLGILAAGAVYVPVGVEQPESRRDRIYARAGVRAVVGGDVPSTPDGPPPAAPLRTDPGSLAYVIFTSGSTGEPKGVEITHAAAVNTIDDINSRYGIGPGDRALAVSALDFDLSVYDIFGLLSAGGALVLIDDEETREARRWARLVAEHHVTVWNSVPALLEMLLTVAGPGELASLRTVLASGDWVGLGLPGRVRSAAPSARFIALGGATEAAIWSNACEVHDVPAHWQSIPYGLPLANQSYRVVDSRGRQCPDWVAGELLIGGTGVARGYRNAPELTAAQFPTDAEGRRWYRTGDHGRYWPDGTLEFLGRRDSRVKIRGHRIELGELESVAEELDSVQRAVAVTVGEGVSAQLALAVTAHADPGVLRRELAVRLPAYLLPEHIAVLDELPLSPNGKIDRVAVARAFDVDAVTPQDEPPSGPTEVILAGLLTALLGTAKVGRHRSFFALGGDSLLATRLVEQIRLRFGVELTLRRLLAAPTVAGLAGLVDAASAGTTEFDEGEI